MLLMQSVTDVQQWFPSLLEVKPTPHFCLRLFIPLIQHAVKNKGIQHEIDIYSTFLENLSTYMYEENEPCMANKLFNSFQNFAEGLSKYLCF